MKENVILFPFIHLLNFILINPYIMQRDQFGMTDRNCYESSSEKKSDNFRQPANKIKLKKKEHKRKRKLLFFEKF